MKTIPFDDAAELYMGGSTDEFECLASEEQGTDRWSSYELVVFRDKVGGGIWGFVVGTGLTEDQDYITLNGQTYNGWYSSDVPEEVEVKLAVSQVVTRTVWSLTP